MPRPRISGTIALSSPPAGAEEAAAPILAEASNASGARPTLEDPSTPLMLSR